MNTPLLKDIQSLLDKIVILGIDQNVPFTEEKKKNYCNNNDDNDLCSTRKSDVLLTNAHLLINAQHSAHNGGPQLLGLTANY